MRLGRVADPHRSDLREIPSHVVSLYFIGAPKDAACFSYFPERYCVGVAP